MSFNPRGLIERVSCLLWSKYNTTIDCMFMSQQSLTEAVADLHNVSGVPICDSPVQLLGVVTHIIPHALDNSEVVIFNFTTPNMERVTAVLSETLTEQELNRAIAQQTAWGGAPWLVK